MARKTRSLGSPSLFLQLHIGWVSRTAAQVFLRRSSPRREQDAPGNHLAVLAMQSRGIFEEPQAVFHSKPSRQERNFLLQRLVGKMSWGDARYHRQRRNSSRTTSNIRQKGAFFVRVWSRQFGRTGWWCWNGPNCQLPTQSSNLSLSLEPGTESFDAETAGELGTFAAISGAETALPREFDRQVATEPANVSLGKKR